MIYRDEKEKRVNERDLRTKSLTKTEWGRKLGGGRWFVL